MKNNQRNSKTIDLNATKKQRSPKNSHSAYFNPYVKSTDYRENNGYEYRTYSNEYHYERYNNSPYDNTSYDNNRYNQQISPEMRKKQLRERNKLSKQQIRKIKRRRKINFIIKLVIAMLFTVIVVWSAIGIKDMLTYPKISYQIVQTGTIDSSSAFNGIIIRNEKVYYSQDEGTMQTIIAEGEKVKKDGEVCAIINDAAYKKAEAEKDLVSTELYKTADSRKQISYYQDEAYQIDQQIKNTMDTFYKERLSDTTDYIYAIRSEIENNIGKRTELYVKEQKPLNHAAAQKLSALDSQINGLQHISRAELSGIISYKIDGAEDKLGPQEIETIDYNQFKELTQENFHNLGNNTSITKGIPLYKIISDNTWYIITYTELEEGENYKEGKNYLLNFEMTSRLQINFTLRSKIIEEDRVRLVFETNERIGQFSALRKIDFSIGNKNEEGLKIPVQAIVEQSMLKIPEEYKMEKDNTVGVYRKNGELVEFVKIKPQYEKDGEIYILQEIGERDSLQVNNLLVHPLNQTTVKIDSVETIEGVYVINGKLAQFKEIDVYLQNNAYALVKYSVNNKLKELDKIISNPKSIKRDQLLQHMNIQNE